DSSAAAPGDDRVPNSAVPGRRAFSGIRCARAVVSAARTAAAAAAAVPRPARRGTMSTTRSTLGCTALTALLLTAACVSPEEHRRALSANSALQAELASLGETQRNLQKENEHLRADLERLGKQAADADWIREQKQKLDELLKQYPQGGPGAVPGVELVRTS